MNAANVTLADIFDMAPKEFGRYPGGIEDEHEAMIELLAQQGLVEITHVPAVSGSGKAWQCPVWRRAKVATFDSV